MPQEGTTYLVAGDKVGKAELEAALEEAAEVTTGSGDASFCSHNRSMRPTYRGLPPEGSLTLSGPSSCIESATQH
jgi:hypothetical protein